MLDKSKGCSGLFPNNQVVALGNVIDILSGKKIMVRNIQKERNELMKAKKLKRKEQEVLQTLWEITETFYKALFKQCSALEKALDASLVRQQKLEERLAVKAKTSGALRKRVGGKRSVGRPKGSKNLRPAVKSKSMTMTMENIPTGT